MTSPNEKHFQARKEQVIVAALISALLVLMFAAYANLRWANESPAFEKAKTASDTKAYVRISGDALLAKDFWANTRPPIFPLVLKMFAADSVEVAAFHAAFSIFAWGMLALAVAFTFRLILRPIAFGLFLALSLDRHIAGWDLVMLSESLSVSLLALFLAAWLWLLNGWSWWKAFFLSLIAFFWAFTRDTNGWILLMLSGLIVSGVLFFGAGRRYLSVAGVFVLLFGLSNLSADIGQRWIYPFQNVLAGRILPDQEALASFADCGLPVTPELMGLAGGYAESGERAFYEDPALQPYRDWLYRNGKNCYMRWLVSDLLLNLRLPLMDLGTLLVFENVEFFYPQSYESVLPWYAEKVLYPGIAVVWLWALISLSALIAVITRAWRTNKAWVVFIALCLLIYPHLFIVWHGDVPGTQRHALTISLQFVLSFWLLGLLLLETVLARLRVRGFV